MDIEKTRKDGFEIEGGLLKNYYGGKESVGIPSGVIRIRSCAFLCAGEVKHIHIPDSVAEIQPRAFDVSLQSITVSKDSLFYEVTDGLLIDKRKGSVVFALPGFSFPADGRIKAIGEAAFSKRKEIESLSLPNGVKKIERSAFNGCVGLKRVSLPSSLKSVGESIFCNCDKLAEIEVGEGACCYFQDGCLIERRSGRLIRAAMGCLIPNEVRKIGMGAFGNGHKSLHFPKSVIRGIEDGFCGCETLESLTVDEGNPTYYSRDNCIIGRKGKRLVHGCVNSVIPSDGSVKIIGRDAFRESKTERVILPHGIERIEDFAFGGCDKMSEIVLPETLKSIGDHAFIFCFALTEITLPKKLKSIGEWAFGFCKNLTHITLPASLEEIGECAFDVESVTFEDKEDWYSELDYIPPEKLEEAAKDGFPLKKLKK